MAEEQHATSTVVADSAPKPLPHLGEDTGEEILASGVRLGSYTLREVLGSGGCATVYLAEGAQSERVAIKVLQKKWVSNLEMVQRFLFEVRAATSIKHPGIVEVHGSGVLDDGRPYLVMEYLDGVTLLAYASLHGRFSARESLTLIEPVTSALEAAHAAGIVHRDLKASNIMVFPDERPQRLKLLDFGIAKFLFPEDNTPALTKVGTRLGTPSSMSPEQLRGQPVDSRTDIYSLGVLLFRLLVGRHPFESHDVTEVERMHLEEPPPQPSIHAGVSPEVDRVVLRCLEKSREQRFRNVQEFVQALRAAVDGETQSQANVNDDVAAVGLYVEARMLIDEPDEALLSDFAITLDLVEQQLRDASFEVPLLTGNAVLAVQVLSEDPVTRQATYRSVLGVATSLFEQLGSRPSKHPGLHVNVSLHFDRISMAPSSGTYSGGITRVTDWAPQKEVAGVYVSREAAEAIPEDLATELASLLASR